MRIYSIKRTTTIDADIQNVWNFFATPENLNLLTPPEVHFQILPETTFGKMYAGQIIHYKISPFLGIKFRWTTEITHYEEGKMFIDEQRFGPYSFWHHEHRYEVVDGRVRITDLVYYGLPFGFIGRLAHSLFVRKKLKSIFDYREHQIQKLKI